jgi:hypothetical protein
MLCFHSTRCSTAAAVGKPTTLTWEFPNINRNKPLLTSSTIATTGGDGTVSMQSLKQCSRCGADMLLTEELPVTQQR